MRTTGRCGPIWIATAIVGFPPEATANEELLERCRQTGSDADRIACLEAAVMELGGSTGATPEPPPAAPVARPDPAEGHDDMDVAPPGPDAAGASAIGVEQVEAGTMTREERKASLAEARGLAVEKFERVGYRQLQIRLANGQIWRQIRGDDQEIRVTVERNPTVDIVESSLGGFRLRLNEIRRTIRVRRIR